MRTGTVAILKGYLIRYRMTVLDAILLTTGLCVFFLVALEVDVFRSSGSAEVKGLEIDELLLLATVLLLGLLIIGLRFMAAQRKEITRRKAAERRAHELAMLDSLTGLPNRRKFDQQLKAWIEAPPGADAAHAAFMIDLNGFKNINDVFGHGVGDEVLIHIAIRLKEAAREADLVARLGGDEFAIIANHIRGPDEAARIALRIIEELERPIEIGPRKHKIGAGIGIALIPRDGALAEEILRKADIALYRAKTESISAMCFFEPEMNTSLLEWEFLGNEMSEALSTRAIRPYYQPVVELSTRKIVGFEALARWTHQELGEISPDRFIPLVDSMGMTGEFTNQLFRQACQDALNWPGDLILAFNISPAQLHSRVFASELISILTETGLPPHRLELELTEADLVKDLNRAKESLETLRAVGVRIALDDFGTGYSTLYHLRNFHVDKIKVDRSFVETMERESEAAALVRAIINLGIGLGLTVTAEGVENAEQEIALLENGCQQAQGFLFSKAVSADDAMRLIGECKAAGTLHDGVELAEPSRSGSPRWQLPTPPQTNDHFRGSAQS